MKPTNQNIVLGAGYLYWDLFDANGDRTGELYLGDTPGFEVDIATENVEVFSSDGPIAEKLEDISTQINRTVNITGRNISATMLALFLIGSQETVDQSSDSITDERHTGKQGRWIQLGQTDADPIGARDVSSVVVNTDPDGTPVAMTAGTDYEVEAETGRIYIIEGGGIDNAEIGIDYDVAAISMSQVSSDNLGAKTGALRFVAANTRGENRDAYFPSVTMRPNGAMQWKSRTEVQSMNFAAGIQKKGNLSQAYINGRPVASS